MIGDSASDAGLVADALRDGGVDATIVRVATRKALRRALADAWSVILCDDRVPAFDALAALQAVKDSGSDAPFIVVSELFVEQFAVEALRSGAADFVMKSNLMRLPDVIRRELAEVELRREQRHLAVVIEEAEDRFRAAFEQSAIGIAISSLDARIVDLNESFAALLGRTREEAIGLTMKDITHPDDYSKSSEQIALVAGNAGRAASYDKRYVRPDGSIVWAHVTLSSARKNGPSRYFVVMVEDITATRHAEEELRARDTQFAIAARMAKLGGWQLDLRTGERKWTAEMWDLVGSEPGKSGEAIERLIELTHPEDVEAVRELAARHSVGDPHPLDFRVIVDGELRHMHVEAQVVRDESSQPQHVVGFARDVTQEKRVEAELRLRRAQQHAIAELGRAGLGGSTIDELFELACSSAHRVLEDSVSSVVVEHLTRDIFRVAAIAGSYIFETGESLAIPRHSCCGHALASRTVIKVHDALIDKTPIARPFVASGARSGVAAPIATGTGRAAAVLAVHSRQPLAFDADDVNFIGALANVLAQAIDQHAADDAVRRQAAEQVAVAQFAARAASGVTNEVLHEAATILRDLLGTDYALYLGLDASREWFEFRAGYRWLPEGTRIHIGSGSHAGYAIASDTLVITPDYGEETRFDNAIFVAHGIGSGMFIPVRSSARVYGALGVQSRSQRTFTLTESQFLRAMAGAIADALDRDEAHRALVESEERYRTVVDSASDIIYSVDAEGRFTSFNKAFTRVTGLAGDEWLGRQFRAILPHYEQEPAAGAWAALMRGAAVRDLEFDAVKTGGGVRRLSISSEPVMKDGVFMGAHCFARDITLTHTMQQERDRLTRDLQLLLESTEEGIVALDLDGFCTMINGAATKTLGIEPADAIETRFHDLVHDHSPADPCAIELALRHGGSARVTDDTFRRGDVSFPADYSVAAIVDDRTRKGVVLTFTNTTERRKLEVQLEQADRLSSLGRLAATIAHEFNNVLMGVSPFVEVLRRTDSADKRESALSHIGSAIKRGKRITEEILRYTHPVPPVLEPVAIAAWFEAFTREMRSLAGSQYEIHVDVRDPSLAVLADALQFHQVLSNVVLNARDAMKDGGRISIRAGVDAPETQFAFGVVPNVERFVHFVVEDQGCGIPQSFLRHVFEPLFTTKRNGTGLGLAVAHQVVRQHHGSIFVESTAGVGTAFHIFLPRSSSGAEQQVVPEAAGETPAVRPAVRTMLLVEDDEHVAEGLQIMLELEGIDVELVMTGREVLPAIGRRRPDVVVLDVGLPDIVGTRVYADIAAHFPDLPVVFSTGHGDERKLDAWVERGNVAMLLKPYGVKTLLETVERLTGKAQAAPRIAARMT